MRTRASVQSTVDHGAKVHVHSRVMYIERLLNNSKCQNQHHSKNGRGWSNVVNIREMCVKSGTKSSGSIVARQLHYDQRVYRFGKAAPSRLTCSASHRNVTTDTRPDSIETKTSR